MDAIAALLRVADAYSSTQGVGLSTTSWRALGDTKKLAALKDGRDIQVRRCRAAMQWFSDNWPAGAAWPDDVPRPDPTPAEAAA